jgi:hypothetical protein
MAAVVTRYRGAIGLQRDRAFGEFLTKTGQPTNLLAKAQANLGLSTPAGSPVLTANLPATPVIGQMAQVSDGVPALAWGAALAGTGTTPYLVWWNGTAWTVIGH